MHEAVAHDFWLIPDMFGVAGNTVSLRLHQKPAAAGQYLIVAGLVPRTTRAAPAGLIRYLKAEGGGGADGVVHVPLTKAGAWMLRSAFVSKRPGGAANEWDVSRSTYVFNVGTRHQDIEDVMKGLIAGCALVGALTLPVSAQTDYYNTDRGRPLRIEDAYALEYRGLELQAAPLRVERSRGGVYNWGIEPELAIGFLPRTHLEVGLPLAFIDGGGGRQSSGVAGLEVSLLHNLNAETSIPALAVVLDALFPVGSLGPDRTYVSATGIITKTFSWARFHVNGQYTVGDAPAPGSTGIVEASRWLAGLAVDKTYPLRAMLVSAELYASQPLHSADPLEWTSGAGIRYQLNPRWALDGGAGRRFTGDDEAWYVTFGTAYAFGLPWRR